MAGIDKIYGTGKQLLEFRAWLKENKPEYLDMVNDPDHEYYHIYRPDNENGIISISNFSEDADKWLYVNCPILFVVERIHEQYDGDPNEAQDDNT